jgi:hypothetical protein
MQPGVFIFELIQTNGRIFTFNVVEVTVSSRNNEYFNGLTLMQSWVNNQASKLLQGKTELGGNSKDGSPYVVISLKKTKGMEAQDY